MNIQKYFQKYIEFFNSSLPNFKLDETDYIIENRINALEDFKSCELPDKKNEQYKNSDIEEIYSREYNIYNSKDQEQLDISSCFKCETPDMETHILYLTNGKYFDDNNIVEGNENIIICSIEQAFKKHPKIIEKYFNKSTKSHKDCFINLNTMLSKDGLFIYVPENTNVDKVIQVVNLFHGQDNKNIFKRNLFIIEKNSNITLLFCDHNLHNTKDLSIEVSEVFVADNSNFRTHNLQSNSNEKSQINTQIFNLEKNAEVHSFTISLCGGAIINNIYTNLNAEHSKVNLYGLNLTDKEQKVDNFTHIDHKHPNCTSTQLYKGILDDKAMGSFLGTIIVRPDAQKTEAYQTNNNLCFSDDSHMVTKPQLEIYADDVKCSHGATVGQLDRDALFYLRQRGISEKEAKLMLTFAFANDVLSLINIDSLRLKVSKLTESRLRGEFTSFCRECSEV